MPTITEPVANLFPKLLGYGVSGLSVVMFMLAFFLFYKVVSAKTVSPQKARLSIVFLVASLLFFALGGAMSLYQAEQPASIVLRVSPWYEGYNQRYGEVHVFHGDDSEMLKTTALRLDVKDRSEVMLEISKLKEKFDELRDEVETYRAQVKSLGQRQFKGRADVGMDEPGT